MTDATASGDKLRLFISYSRRNMDAADALVTALEDDGFEVTIDRRDLPYGEEWQKELADFIRASDTVVWLVSPESIKSKWCNWELGEVARLNKRLVPVNVSAVTPEELPEALGKIHLLPVEGVYAAQRHFAVLVATLNTDRVWVKDSTRLADRAREWIGRNHDDGLLLRGLALKSAETWSTRRPKTAPPPASEVLELILASRRAAVRRQRWTVAGAFTVATVAIGLAGLAWWQRYLAIERQNQALTNESRLLVGLAERNTEEGDAIAGSLLAIAALPDAGEGIQRPYVAEAEQKLYDGLLKQRERVVLDERATGRSISARSSPDGKRITTISESNVLRIREIESGRELRLLRGRDGIVESAHWSPDGKRMVAVLHEAGAQLWDVEQTREVAVLTGPGPTYSIAGAAFSSEGQRVVTVAENGQARIYDAESGLELVVLEHPNADFITSAAFSPDGRLLATGSNEGKLRLWDWANKQELNSFEGHDNRIVGIFFSPGGNRVITASWDKTVRLWDLQANNPPTVLKGHNDIILSVELSPDGRRLLTGSQDHTARLWDIENGREIVPVLAGHTGDVVSVAFSPEGLRVVTASSDWTARIWDVDTGQPYAVLRGHRRSLSSGSFTADGKGVVTCGDDETTRIWAVESAFERGVLKGHDNWLEDAIFSPDGERLVTVSNDHMARIWAAESGREIAVMRHHTQPVVDAAFSPDGERLITVSWDGTAQRWNGRTGVHLGEAVGKLDNWIGLSALSRDGARLVTVNDQNKTATLWDVENGKRIATLRDPSGRKHYADVKSAAFSRDGTRLATIAVNEASNDGKGLITLSNDNSIWLWNAVTGESLRSLAAGESPVLRAVFSQDGKRLATASGDGKVRIWDLDTKRVVLLKADREMGLNAHQQVIEFSPDGRRVTTVLGRAGQVWDAQNGQLLTKFPTEEDRVDRVLFTPNGKRLVTVHNNPVRNEYRVRLWNAHSGDLVALLTGHMRRISSIAVAPNGGKLATTSHDGTARLWPIFSNTEDLQHRAKQAVPRCLTSQEREHFHLDGRIPAWCTAGARKEFERDLVKLEEKWPYHTPEQRQ
jgi:WD40 repeat protein